MSRDQLARVACYITGGASCLGLMYFAHMPKAAALDFRSQMALSRFAGAMAVLAAVTSLGGFFRQDGEIRILTPLYGVAMCLLWAIILAGHLPVA